METMIEKAFITPDPPAKRTRLRRDVSVRADGVAFIQIIDVVGEVDLSTVESLRSALTQALLAPPSQILVNLRDVRSIDSTGLGVLIGGLKRARERGGSIRLVGANDHVTKILAITGVSAVFPLFDSVEEAIRDKA
jgi:anti-sigma B factor antagonist